MALSANTPRTYESGSLEEKALPVQASTTIYAGSALTIDSGGEVGPLASADAGFYGFAANYADNSGGSAGDIEVAVYVKGVVKLTITGLDDNNDIGDIVYASDDNTFTLTSTTTNKAIGRVAQIESLSAGTAMVRFESLGHEHWND